MSDNTEKVVQAKRWSERFKNSSLEDIVQWAWDFFGEGVIQCTSFGPEGQVVGDAIARSQLPISLHTINTGWLFDETLALRDQSRKFFNKDIHEWKPEPEAIEGFITRRGPFPVYQSMDLRKECCSIRKLEPLRRMLAGRSAWITGIRQEQTSERSSADIVEWDDAFQLFKINPVFNWSQEAVWERIYRRGIPYNELHNKGYPSIGCEPCTRAVKPGENERAGRWWWEISNQKECGLHLRTAAGRAA